MLEPMILSARNSGRSRRISFSTAFIRALTAGFMKITVLLTSAIITLLVTDSSALRRR